MNEWMDVFYTWVPNAWLLLNFVYTHTIKPKKSIKCSQIQRNKENLKNEKEPREFFTILKYQYHMQQQRSRIDFVHWIWYINLEWDFFGRLFFFFFFLPFILHGRELSKIEIKMLSFMRTKKKLYKFISKELYVSFFIAGGTSVWKSHLKWRNVFRGSVHGIGRRDKAFRKLFNSWLTLTAF